MVRYPELIQKPVNIQGQEVILILDTLTDYLEHHGEGYTLVASAAPTHADIYVKEQELKALKIAFPNTPVYGFWHVLLASQLVRPDVEAQILPLTEHEGVFIRVDADTGRALLTGEYSDGIFQKAGDLSLTDAVVIDFQLSNLRLPQEQAKLLEELTTEYQNQKRKTQLFYGLAVVGVLLGAYLVDAYLVSNYETRLQAYQQKKLIFEQLSQDIAELRRTRLAKRPDYSKLLTQLSAIGKLHSAPVIEQQSLGSGTITVLLSNQILYDPKILLPWIVSSTQLPSGHWRVTWSMPHE